jgi:hypothetical protein
VVKTEYVQKTVPPLPAKAQYFEVKFSLVGGLYCVNDDGAKRFILNKKIQDNREADLETIIEGLR